MLRLVRIYLTLPSEIKDLASDFLLGLGAISTSEDGTGTEVFISALFPIDADMEIIIHRFKNYLEFLKNNFLDFDLGEINTEHIDHSSWEAWKKRLKKVKVGNICITPPWDTDRRDDNKLLVVINPSMAFGTGHHETTKLCIKYIESLSDNKNLNTILDVGCGSAILSIVAVKLGIRKAFCFDTDLVAIKEAKENLVRNKVENRVISFCGPIQSIRGTYDIIAANITLETLLSMRSEFKAKLSPRGFLILSGILVTQKRQLINGFIDAGFKQVGERIDGEWAGVAFTTA